MKHKFATNMHILTLKDNYDLSKIKNQTTRQDEVDTERDASQRGRCRNMNSSFLWEVELHWKRKLRAGLQFLCFLYFHIPFLCNKSVLLTQFKAIGFDLRKMDIGEQANAL